MTVDRVGRLVIPKQLRAALGIVPDTELELLPDDGLPVLGLVEGVVLTDDDVRRLRVP